MGGGILEVELIISVAQDQILCYEPNDLVLIRANPYSSVVAFFLTLA